MTLTILFGCVLTLIACFALTNGFLDGGGIVSTVITTRAMEPLTAIVVVACCEVVGVSLLGHAVVRTIGLNMIFFPPNATPKETLSVLLAGVAGALIWNAIMWRLAWPSSSSHALLGGLIGAMGLRFGLVSINWTVVVNIVGALALVPLIAALLGFFSARIVYGVGQYMTPGIGRLLRGLHVIVLTGLALVHSSNDGQKSMALMLLAFLAFGWVTPSGHLPPWVGLSCGLALGLGVVLGSSRTIHTVGRSFYRVQSLQGLCAESAAMVLVGASSVAGFPVSSSHVMSSAVIGAGAGVRANSVRWDLARNIGTAWVLTIPAAAALAALLSYVVSKTI